MLEQDQLNRIQDPQLRQVVQHLANLLEQSLAENDALRAEIQRLKDEINRLKGEQGKPTLKPNKKADETNHSSEEKRKKPQGWSKSQKNDTIRITRTEVVSIDPATLPADAQFKGYERVLVQNLKLTLDNVAFDRAKYYSPSTRKTYLAPLPPGYEGQFGPDLKVLLLGLHHLANVSQPALHTFLTHAGIKISTGFIGDFLTLGQDTFHHEKAAIGLAGLESSPWQQTDDTATRLNGVNAHCHVLCNPLYTSYSTLKKKDRRGVLTVLHNSQPVPFLLNAQVWTSEAIAKLPHKWQKLLATWPSDTLLDEVQVSDLLDNTMPTLPAVSKKSLLDAMALAGYHAQTVVPVVKLLCCDDAPQFPGLTPQLGLCWIHDGRHYEKLTPHLPCFVDTLKAFQEKYWAYYKRLLAYQENPTPEDRQVLWDDFDTLLAAETGYGALDYRLKQTASNKDKLLAVLWHPEIPLHNNASELAVRRRVRKRDVSFGPRSAAGAAGWDTFQTIAATAQKLGVSFLSYLTDRVSGRNEMPSLASLITERAGELQLGASWG